VTYSVSILRTAQKQLERIPAEAQDRVAEAMAALAESPRPQGSVKLTGRDAQRIRVGAYRVIYEISDDTKAVLVVAVSHRKDVYR